MEDFRVCELAPALPLVLVLKSRLELGWLPVLGKDDSFEFGELKHQRTGSGLHVSGIHYVGSFSGR